MLLMTDPYIWVVGCFIATPLQLTPDLIRRCGLALR
jgi:hypothetical protein